MVGIGRIGSHTQSARIWLWALSFAHLEQMETHPAAWHAIPDARHRKRRIMHQRIRCRLLSLIRLFAIAFAISTHETNIPICQAYVRKPHYGLSKTILNMQFLNQNCNMTTTFHRIQMQGSNYLVVIHDRQLFPPPAIALCRNNSQPNCSRACTQTLNLSIGVTKFPRSLPMFPTTLFPTFPSPLM